jgi:HPt (histidine-containing phosphotransfer) domain-containing protein
MWWHRQISFFPHIISVLWLLLLGAGWATPAWAVEPYEISDHMKGDALGLHFEILEDKSNKLQFHEILQRDANGEFRPSLEKVPNFGLRRGAQWVKFTIHNPLDHAVQVMLENKFTFNDSLQIYYQGADGNWLRKEAGDQLPFVDRDIPTRQAVFRLSLAPGSHRFFARSFADGAHQLPLHIWTQDEFFSHNSQEYGLIGVLIGFHVVICLYNLFLFFSLRDKTYLYYVLYVTFNLFYQTSGLGLMQQTLSSLGIMESLSNRFMVINVDLIAITALLFSYHFLNIKQRLPIFRSIFLAVAMLDLINLVITAFFSVWLGTVICLVNASLATSALIMAGVLIARQRYVPGIFFITGWGFYLFGVTGTVTNLMGFLPTSNLTRWGQFTGGAIEIAVLSLALGARINAKRRQTVELITQLNQELETKVEERTTEIQSLLRHIPQGILSIGHGGLISPNYSAQLPHILGHGQIAGQSFRAIILDRSTLAADEKDQAWQAIQASVEENSLSFDLNEDKLPSQLTYAMEGRVKELRLTWNRELNAQDEIKHILVTLLDVSSEVAAQHEVERQNQEFDIIRQLVEIGSRKSIQFFSSGNQLIAENERLVSADVIDADTIKILFVNTHTLKGAARSLNLKDLANEFHRIETYYAVILRQNHAIDAERIRREFQEAQAVYQRYHRANRETLGRFDDLKKITVDRDLLQDNVTLLRQLADFGPLPWSLKESILLHRDEMTRMIFTKLDDFVREMKHQADKIAKDLGREPPVFKIDSMDILINYSQELALKNSFIHLLRNALDHGIEAPDVRQEKGKPARGTLVVSAKEDGGQIVIEFGDDGCGLDIGRIRELCRANSPGSATLPAQELAAQIFETGFSTRESVTLTSGRGVGLSAVRQFLEAEGGAMEIVLGTRIPGPGEFHEFSIHLHLPATVSASWQRMVDQAS